MIRTQVNGSRAAGRSRRARPQTLSLIPEVVHVDLYAGDGAAIRVQATDDFDEPLELTGEVHAQIRRQRPDDEWLLEWAADLTDADQGVVTLTLTGEETHSLVLELDPETIDGRLVLLFRGVWDVQWTPDGAEPLTLLQGNVTCQLDVTRVADGP